MNESPLDRRAEELRLAELAVRQGLVTSEAVAESLRRLEAFERKGIRHTLSEILTQDATLRPEQIAELRRVLSSQATVVQPEAGTKSVRSGGAQEISDARASGAMRGLPRAGDIFGNYEIRRELGRGGMGIVYEAWQEGLKRRIALKILHVHLVSSAEMVARFRREAESAAKLAHPGIVHIYEFGEACGFYFYAMEFLDGQTFDEWRRNTVPGSQQAARYILEAARALDHAHHMGIIHRDLKPANLFLTKDDKVFITDFGLARSEAGSGLTATGAIIGTPVYMSPEQALGAKGGLDRRSDIYSLCMTLYVLVTGRLPFEGLELHDILSQVVHEDPPLPTSVAPGLSPDLEAIILKGAAKSPEHRYGSALELAADLRRYLEGEPVDARRAGWLTGARGRRRLTMMVGVLGLAAAVAAGVRYWPSRQPVNPDPPVANLPVEPTPVNAAMTNETAAVQGELDRERLARIHAEAESFDLRAKLRSQEGKFEECLALLTQAEAIDPGQLERARNMAITYFNLGSRHLDAGRWKEALAEFEHAAEKDRTIPKLFCSRGCALERSGDGAGALKAYDEALRNDIQDVDAHLGSARIYVAQGQADYALGVLDQALRSIPGAEALHAMRASLLRRSGQAEGAKSAIAEGLKACPESLALMHEQGLIALQVGDYSAAESCFTRVLAKDPGRLEPRFQRAQARIGLKQWADALADLDAIPEGAAGIEPGAAASLRATVLYAQGHGEEGADLCARTLAADAVRNPEVRSALRYLQGACEFKAGRLPAAVASFRTVVEAGRKNADDAAKNLAECLITQNDRAGAIGVLKDLLVRSPGDARAQARLRELEAGGKGS